MPSHIGRFILRKNWVREDRTVKQHAFIPPADGRLSVNEHSMTDVDGLWPVGEDVARKRNVELFGRADVAVTTIDRTKLKVEPAPLPGNPTHAEVTDWPPAKEDRKTKAQALAAEAEYHPKPYS